MEILQRSITVHLSAAVLKQITVQLDLKDEKLSSARIENLAQRYGTSNLLGYSLMYLIFRKLNLELPTSVVVADDSEWNLIRDFVKDGVVMTLTLSSYNVFSFFYLESFPDVSVPAPAPGTCDKCEINPAGEEGSCPFAAEADNDPDSLCHCCDSCRHECAMDV